MALNWREIKERLKNTFAPFRKNPVEIKNDEQLTDKLKGVTVGGNDSALRISTDQLNVKGTFSIQESDTFNTELVNGYGSINMAQGTVGFKQESVIFNSTVSDVYF